MRRRRGIPDGVIFPFVSVLFCTIGALALLWAAGSLEAVVEDPDLPERVSQAEIALSERREQMHQAEAEVQRLDQARTAAAARLDELQERARDQGLEVAAEELALENLRAAAERLRTAHGDLARLREEVAQRRELLASLEERRDLVQRRRAAEAELAALTPERARQVAALAEAEAALARELARRAALEERQRAVEAEAGPVARLRLDDARGVRPLWIEVAAEGLRVAGDPALPFQDRAAFTGTNGPIGSVVPDIAAGRVHPVLLLRPGGHGEYHNLVAWLRSQRIPHAAEPVDAGWALRPEPLAEAP